MRVLAETIKWGVLLVVPLAVGLTGRWTMKIATPRADWRACERAWINVCNWSTRVYHRARMGVREQLGITQLALRNLRRRVQRGDFCDDLA